MTKRILKSQLKTVFYDKLDMDKIKINWNEKPIKMEIFLSFLLIKVNKTYDHLGSDNGWTCYKNDYINLKVGGGIVNGIEYLDRIKFRKILSNPYNNYVNPFYLFDIMNEKGKSFFYDYYKNDIIKIIEEQKYKIEILEKNIIEEKQLLSLFKKENSFLEKIK